MFNFFAAFLLTIATATQANNDSAEVSIKKLEKYNSLNVIEKVHLHTDRPFYSIGDTLWFKAYSVVGERNLATQLSSYLYVELLHGDTIKHSLKLKLKKGMANGEFPISDDLAPGNYTVRAFTNWMRNFSQQHYFEKAFIIKSNIQNRPASMAGTSSPLNIIKKGQRREQADKVILQLFPEGGTLVNGVLSRVGFKALGPDGLSRDISGFVMDELGNKICHFQSLYAGMGNFSFIPSKSSKYKVVYTYGISQQGEVEMPSISVAGYSLAVNNVHAERIAVHISASEAILPVRGQLTLLGFSNGHIVYRSTITLDSTGVFTGLIPKKSLNKGVLQLTVFDAQGRPVAERLVFVRPLPNINPLLVSDKPVYHTRERVKLQVFSRDTLNTVKSAVSVSVTDESAAPFDDDEELSIYTSLLLNSDIKGYVENPNHYFNHPDATRNMALDNLLLTQGWRRYNWDEIMAETYIKPRFWPEIDYSVSGTVNNRWGKPVKDATVILLPVKEVGVPQQVTTDSLGKFFFRTVDYSDSSSFIIQAKNSLKDKEVFLTLDKPGAEPGSKGITPLAVYESVNETISASIEGKMSPLRQQPSNLDRGITLQAVKVHNGPRPYVPTSSWNLNGAGNADKVITSSQLQGAGTLENALYSFVPGYRGQFVQYRRGVENRMQVIVDGTRIDPESAADIVASYTEADIESIEILNAGSSGTVVYGQYGQGGVIMINSKSGKFDIQKKYTPGLAYFIPQKLHRPAEFYSPAYQRPLTKTGKIDARKTVYWNPNILTNSMGREKLEFFTTDLPSTYKVVLEGIDNEGNPLRDVLRFKVQ